MGGEEKKGERTAPPLSTRMVNNVDSTRGLCSFTPLASLVAESLNSSSRARAGVGFSAPARSGIRFARARKRPDAIASATHGLRG